MKIIPTLVLLALAVSLFGCASSKGKNKTLPVEPLAVLKNIETRHASASEIGNTMARARIGWINVVTKNNAIKNYEFMTGEYHFRDGVFTLSAKPAKTVYSSVEKLVTGLRPYVQEMPVGFVLTLDGNLPNANDTDPPEFFQAFVRDEFRTAMGIERIKYALIIASRWEVER